MNSIFFFVVGRLGAPLLAASTVSCLLEGKVLGIHVLLICLSILMLTLDYHHHLPAATQDADQTKRSTQSTVSDLETIELPVSDALDLHHFQPKDLKTLIPEYLQECRDKGILEVRVIHGKGRGVLQRNTHSILKRLPFVREFQLADETSGSWGATWVKLHPVDDD